MTNILICIEFCLSPFDVNEHGDDDGYEDGSYVIDHIDYYLECKGQIVSLYFLQPVLTLTPKPNI